MYRLLLIAACVCGITLSAAAQDIAPFTTPLQPQDATMIHAYLEITLDIAEGDRPQAAAVFFRYRDPFLKTISGAVSKSLLVRTADVQVLHGFTDLGRAEAYLSSPLFTQDVVAALKPFLRHAPEVRIYACE